MRHKHIGTAQSNEIAAWAYEAATKQGEKKQINKKVLIVRSSYKNNREPESNEITWIFGMLIIFLPEVIQ